MFIAEIVIGFLIKRLIGRLGLGTVAVKWLSRKAASWVIRLYGLLGEFIKNKMKVYCVNKSLGGCEYKDPETGEWYPECFVMKSYKWTKEDCVKCEYREANIKKDQ